MGQVYFVTGKLGGGKSLVSVGQIKDHILAGKRVATNLDLYLEHLIPRNTKKCEVYRIPDKPRIEDLESIGRGTNSKLEEDFGLLVLDELGTWLNSRTYQKDRSRQEVIDWFLHARKLGWKVLLLVQNPDLLDKQVRISLGEHTVICRRTDRIPLPLVGWLFKLATGSPMKLPRIHVGSVFYGEGHGAIKVDTWIYRGNHLFNGYDTNQVFQQSENRIAQFIPPAYLDQRRFATINWRFYMRLTKIYFKRVKVPLAFALGVCLNFIFLFVLLGSSGDLSQAVVNESSSIKNEETPEKVVEGGADPGEVVRQLVKIPHGTIYDKYGRAQLMLFHNGMTYELKDFPEEVIWYRYKPYYYAEVKPDEEKVQERSIFKE